MLQETENQRIAFFNTLIGKPYAQSPSAITRWLAGTVEVVKHGYLEMKFVVREDMANPIGILHGGTAAMIMDDMMGGMVYLLGSEYAHTTINLNCDYLNPAPIGTVIVAKATVIREGKNIAHCECVLETEEGGVIAKSTSNLIQVAVKLQF